MPIIEAETKEHFVELIKNDKCIVDFFGTWCMPCKKLLENIDEVLNELPDVTIIKVDVNKLDNVSEMFNVTQIPHLVFFKKGSLQKDYLQTSDHEVLVAHAKKVFDDSKE